MSTDTAVNNERSIYEQNTPRVRWTSSIKTLPPRWKYDNQCNTENQQEATRTIQNNLNILHKTVHKFECLRRGRLSLLSCQPVQSFQRRSHIILSKKLLPKFLCIAWCYQSILSERMRLTQSSLFCLLYCEGDGGKQFD